MARNSNAYDLNIQKQRKTVVKKTPDLRVIKTNKKAVVNKKNRSSLVMFVVIAFAMLMIVSYRYNLISEKNIEVQKLEKNLMATKGALASTEIKLDKAVDIDKVESYSKGQLGMQKAEKSQIVYLDVQNSSNSKKDKTDGILGKVSTFIKGMFAK